MTGHYVAPPTLFRVKLCYRLLTLIHPGIDIKDIPNVNDHDFSLTLNGFFIVRWTDRRLLIQDVKFGPEGNSLSLWILAW